MEEQVQESTDPTPREQPSDDEDPESGQDSSAAVPDTGDRLAHFIRMLSDDSEVSRWKAAETLGRMENPAAVDELIATLWDDDARVRLKAAWALGRIGDLRARAPLQRLYRMEDEWAQEIIKEALAGISDRMSREAESQEL
jgi:HEAT repeat protein